MADEADLLASLHADRFSDYTVMGVIDILKSHGWRVVKLDRITDEYETEDGLIVVEEL